jgi:hypothetical protein
VRQRSLAGRYSGGYPHRARGGRDIPALAVGLSRGGFTRTGFGVRSERLDGTSPGRHPTASDCHASALLTARGPTRGLPPALAEGRLPTPGSSTPCAHGRGVSALACGVRPRHPRPPGRAHRRGSTRSGHRRAASIALDPDGAAPRARRARVEVERGPRPVASGIPPRSGGRSAGGAGVRGRDTAMRRHGDKTGDTSGSPWRGSG